MMMRTCVRVELDLSTFKIQSMDLGEVKQTSNPLMRSCHDHGRELRCHIHSFEVSIGLTKIHGNRVSEAKINIVL